MNKALFRIRRWVSAAIVCGLTLPGAGSSWGQVRSYPVGGAFHESGWVLPSGLARDWIEQGSALSAAQLRQIQGSRHDSLTRRALASLALAQGELQRKQYDNAEQDLRQAANWAPIRGLVASQLAGIRWQQNDWNGVLAVAREYAAALKASPFRFSVDAEAYQSAVYLHQWSEIVRLAAAVPLSAGRLVTEVQALDALGRPKEELRRLEVLEDQYPASAEARSEQAQWRALLHRYPSMAPGWRQLTGRAAAWQRAGRMSEATRTWQQAIAHAPAAERNGLRIRLARAWIVARNDRNARAVLAPLLRGPLRAEALSVDLERARAQNDFGAIERDLELLKKESPASPWYLRALWDAGNAALLNNDLLLAQAHYDAVARRFPHSGSAATAAWRAAWQSYRLRLPDARNRMSAFLRAFPRAPEDADALYWLGRWSQMHGAAALARQYYQADVRRFPGSYFGLQASLQLRPLATVGGQNGPLLRQLLHTLPDAAPPPQHSLTASDRQASRLAQSLASAWMLRPAATVLDAALRHSRRPPLRLARQLIAIDRQRQTMSDGVVAMQRALPGFLDYDWNQLPKSDWEGLFPYPYRDALLRSASYFKVDPFLILGLMRQESDFNPRSFSRARARGLMQLRYSTALMHARGMGWKHLTPDDLFRPEINIPLGVAELKSLLQQFHGQPAYALAAYNAGGSRVTAWLSEGPYRSINEFIESIPFHETRGYVQAVLRNQFHYEHLY